MKITNEIKKEVQEIMNNILDKLENITYGKIELSIDANPERLITNIIGENSRLLKIKETKGELK